MRPIYVSEFAEGSAIDSTLFMRSREMRSTRAGESYLALELSDRSGVIPGVYFRPHPDACAVPAGAVVRVTGTVTRFKGTKRVSVRDLKPATQWDPQDLLGAGTRVRTEMVDELRALARSVTDSGLRRLLRSVFQPSEFFERFCTCPASQSYHHAYLGGLLEHTVSVAASCSFLADRYDEVDRDLLVAAALLHDVGKVDELVFDAGIGYSDEGRLVGHVVLSDARVRRAAESARLDTRTGMRLSHAILSHHGELEWGSPKRPATFEALMLHHVDNMDAKAAGFTASLQGASRLEEPWTDAANLFRRPLYVPQPLAETRPQPPEEDARYFQASA